MAVSGKTWKSRDTEDWTLLHPELTFIPAGSTPEPAAGFTGGFITYSAMQTEQDLMSAGLQQGSIVFAFKMVLHCFASYVTNLWRQGLPFSSLGAG